MHHEPRSEQIKRQVAHFAELEEGMKEYLRTRGFPEGFTKGQMRETTPQHMEMELMLRMWIREEIMLVGNAKGFLDGNLRVLLDERTQGVFSRDFSNLLLEMWEEGELARHDVMGPGGPRVHWAIRMGRA